VSHTALDFHSPAWAVASLAYSRAVTGTAAAWLAVWREARGDTTRMPRAREVAPKEPLPHEESPPNGEAPANGGLGGEPPANGQPTTGGKPPLVNDRRSLQPEAP
jgi:hypothetical protein